MSALFSRDRQQCDRTGLANRARQRIRKRECGHLQCRRHSLRRKQSMRKAYPNVQVVLTRLPAYIDSFPRGSFGLAACQCAWGIEWAREKQRGLPFDRPPDSNSAKGETGTMRRRRLQAFVRATGSRRRHRLSDRLSIARRSADWSDPGRRWRSEWGTRTLYTLANSDRE